MPFILYLQWFVQELEGQPLDVESHHQMLWCYISGISEMVHTQCHNFAVWPLFTDINSKR